MTPAAWWVGEKVCDGVAVTAAQKAVYWATSSAAAMVAYSEA
jgi:hypothetical protein